MAFRTIRVTGWSALRNCALFAGASGRGAAIDAVAFSAAAAGVVAVGCDGWLDVQPAVAASAASVSKARARFICPPLVEDAPPQVNFLKEIIIYLLDILANDGRKSSTSMMARVW